MKIPHFKSIFLKILASYIVALILIITGAAAVRILSFSSPNMEVSVENVSFYASALVNEIENPPDITKALKIAEETGLHISLSGNGILWTSNEDMDDDENEHEDGTLSLEADNILVHFFPGADDISIEIEEGGYTYHFSEFHTDQRISTAIWLIMAFSVLLALTISFLMIRHFLKPIGKMNKVALEFGVADWKQRVNPVGRDELANLGRTLDKMADRIEQYIKSMHDLLLAVSHELRSPLTRMKVALEFIDNTKIRNSLNEEIVALDQLTGNLLEQKRISTQPDILIKEKVMLNNWVRSVYDFYLNTGAPVEFKSEGFEMEASIDRNRMELVLRNLIENSLRHAPGSPIIIHLKTFENGIGFLLEISDSGSGIHEDLISRLGEPFLLGESSRTGERTKGGFGMGMSIVKAITEAHGGVFTARNLEPSGFAVSLQFGSALNHSELLKY